MDSLNQQGSPTGAPTSSGRRLDGESKVTNFPLSKTENIKHVQEIVPKKSVNPRAKNKKSVNLHRRLLEDDEEKCENVPCYTDPFGRDCSQWQGQKCTDTSRPYNETLSLEDAAHIPSPLVAQSPIPIMGMTLGGYEKLSEQYFTNPNATATLTYFRCSNNDLTPPYTCETLESSSTDCYRLPYYYHDDFAGTFWADVLDVDVKKPEILDWREWKDFVQGTNVLYQEHACFIRLMLLRFK